MIVELEMWRCSKLNKCPSFSFEVMSALRPKADAYSLSRIDHYGRSGHATADLRDLLDDNLDRACSRLRAAG